MSCMPLMIQLTHHALPEMIISLKFQRSPPYPRFTIVAYALQFSPNQTPTRDTIFVKLLVGLSQDSSFSVNQGGSHFCAYYVALDEKAQMPRCAHTSSLPDTNRSLRLRLQYHRPVHLLLPGQGSSQVVVVYIEASTNIKCCWPCHTSRRSSSLADAVQTRSPHGPSWSFHLDLAHLHFYLTWPYGDQTEIFSCHCRRRNW